MDEYTNEPSKFNWLLYLIVFGCLIIGRKALNSQTENVDKYIAAINLIGLEMVFISIVEKTYSSIKRLPSNQFMSKINNRKLNHLTYVFVGIDLLYIAGCLIFIYYNHATSLRNDLIALFSLGLSISGNSISCFLFNYYKKRK